MVIYFLLNIVNNVDISYYVSSKFLYLYFSRPRSKVLGAVVKSTFNVINK